MLAKFTAVVKCRCYSDLWKVWHRWDPLYILSGAHFFQGQRRNVSYPRPHDGAARKRKALALQQVRLQKWQNGLILSALQETPQSLKNCWPSNDDAGKWHYTLKLHAILCTRVVQGPFGPPCWTSRHFHAVPDLINLCEFLIHYYGLVSFICCMPARRTLYIVCIISVLCILISMVIVWTSQIYEL